MGGILKRFSDIMSANINALLDKAEDPAKMIDQYMRNLESDLGKVKAETASVMAEESRSKRLVDECNDEIVKMQTYAEKAVVAGNDADARQFLTKKSQLVEKQAGLAQAYSMAATNAGKMKEMHDKLCKDIDELRERKETIKAKVAVARTQETLNKIGESVAGAQDNLSAFDKMEAKADRMLDEANAMAELNKTAEQADLDDLAKKYDTQASPGVEDELAEMKAKLGLK